VQPNKLDMGWACSPNWYRRQNGDHRDNRPDRNKPMKTLTNICYSALAPFALACFTLSPASDAQCPQNCDRPSRNTALGYSALINNTSGSDNTAIGDSALTNNTDGSDNTAIGEEVMTSNTTGNFNNAFGHYALAFNTTGYNNTAIGVYSLESNTTGYSNTATGHAALADNSTGTGNTANGVNALVSNATGNNNVAVGNAALEKITGSRNIALGSSAGRNINTGDDNIHIGNHGLPRDSNVIRIGAVGSQTNTFIAGISGVAVSGGVGVIIDADGHLGTMTSSARYKEAIKPMDKASEAILALKPVTFRYKHELDPDGIPQFGLVAEEVAKVDPGLVARDDQGKPYTVCYEAVNAMLLNEFLKEHKKVKKQEADIAQLKSTVKILVADLKAQAVQIQQVNALLEANKARPRVAAND